MGRTPIASLGDDSWILMRFLHDITHNLLFLFVSLPILISSLSAQFEVWFFVIRIVWNGIPIRVFCVETYVVRLLLFSRLAKVDQVGLKLILTIYFRIFGPCWSLNLHQSTNKSFSSFLIPDLSRSRFRESNNGLAGVLHSSQRRLQVVGWVA